MATTAPSILTNLPLFSALDISDCQTGIVAVFIPLPIPVITLPTTNCPNGQCGLKAVQEITVPMIIINEPTIIKGLLPIFHL